MKHLIQKVILLLVGYVLFFGVSFGDLRVEIPIGDEFVDIIADDSIITTNKAEGTFTKMIQLINTYLWIVVLIVFMIMLIYAGFTLITSRGDPEKFKKGNMMLLYIGIGIGVALLAYVIINLVVNFF